MLWWLTFLRSSTWGYASFDLSSRIAFFGCCLILKELYFHNHYTSGIKVLPFRQDVVMIDFPQVIDLRLWMFWPFRSHLRFQLFLVLKELYFHNLRSSTWGLNAQTGICLKGKTFKLKLNKIFLQIKIETIAKVKRSVKFTKLKIL